MGQPAHLVENKLISHLIFFSNDKLYLLKASNYLTK